MKKITRKDGTETIVVQLGDTVEVLTMAEWSKLIATPTLEEAT